MSILKHILEYTWSVLRQWFAWFALAMTAAGIISHFTTKFTLPNSVWIPIAILTLFIAQFQAWAKTKKELDHLKANQQSDQKLQETLNTLATYVGELKEYRNESINNKEHLTEVINEHERCRRSARKVIENGLSKAESELFFTGGANADSPYVRKVPVEWEDFDLRLAHTQARIVWDIDFLEKLIQRYSKKKGGEQ